MPSAPIPPPQRTDEITQLLQGLKEGLRRELNCPLKCQELEMPEISGLLCSDVVQGSPAHQELHIGNMTPFCLCAPGVYPLALTEVSFCSVWVRMPVRKGESEPKVACLACRNMLCSSAAPFACLDKSFLQGCPVHPSSIAFVRAERTTHGDSRDKAVGIQVPPHRTITRAGSRL